jgi:two-component system chemotaxis sensor kinase CheA
VAAEKLDAFLARNGELLVARRRVESRVEDVTALRDFVGRWKAEWRGVEKPLAKFLRDSETAPHPEEGGRLPRRAAEALGRVGASLRRLEKDLDQLSGTLLADGRVLKEAAASIDDEVRRVRMLPFAEACQGLDRLVRDLAQATGKEADLVIEGGSVELDRSVLEGLKDPLRHLLRNALDHGIEPPAERRSADKSPRGRLLVAAVLRGSAVEVVVADDGRGLDLGALRQQASKRRLPEPADERDLARLIFLPGFSTSPFITDVSGRGVGLDVVKSRVEALHGSVDLSFTPGGGTRFTLAVPLTLTTLRVLLVTAGGQTFAFVGANVQRLVRTSAEDIRSVEGREMLALGGAPIPVVSLAATLGLRPREPVQSEKRAPAVIVAAGEKRLAFVVEELLAEQVVVVKGLGARIRRMRFVSAATILPSGRIALVLNTTNLVRAALSRAPAELALGLDQTADRPKKRLLVVDDSVTTRTLEKSILEAAGYEVAIAADGAVAWQLLQERGTDLLVSDVDMPRMDGFALTEAVRGSKRFADLPVVLVTARETEADKARGVAVGANAYLVKSAFDQKNLLETIAQLL